MQYVLHYVLQPFQVSITQPSETIDLLEFFLTFFG